MVCANVTQNIAIDDTKHADILNMFDVQQETEAWMTYTTHTER